MINNVLPYVIARLAARHDESDRGATMVEYGLLIGVVVLAILVGALAFGNNIADWFTNTLSTRVTSQ